MSSVAASAVGSGSSEGLIETCRAYTDAIRAPRNYVSCSTPDRHRLGQLHDRPPRRRGKDLIMYGDAPLGATLLEHGRRDELQFAVHPSFTGEGAPLRRQGATSTLELAGAKTLGTGVIAPRHRPAGG